MSNKFVEGYIECACWAESANTTDSDDRSIGDVAELAPETFAAMEKDATAFYAANAAMISKANEVGRDDARLGHDFWLSRNGHGTGFWDRDLGDIGEALHAAAKAAGGRDLYIGDDGMIYQS